MFPSFIGILDIQSWWEVPSIAYFCSLFRTAFDLLDFDIEELEEALLTDGTEECASSLLTELIVRLLKGCLGNNDISAFNYQMYLRRLFRRKCQETGRYNPFNTDIDFQFLPLRTKVEILYALCDFRLDADDVFDLFKNLEAESLRVEPLGWDDNGSAFWYFYGTRLYREDIIKRPKGKSKKKKSKEEEKHGWLYGDDWLDDEDTERVWQVVCFTEADWAHLTNKFSKGTSKVERKLYRSLSQNFLPEIPRLFQEKERLQRKRLLELPRRTSSRVLQKIKQKEEENKQSESEQKNPEEERRGRGKVDRENRAKRRDLLKSKRSSSSESDHSSCSKEIPLKKSKCNLEKISKNSPTPTKGEPPPEPPVKMGRKTNNSLSSATGEILISDDEPVNSTRKKLKTSQIFSQSEEDIKTDMYKVLEQLITHEDAWPFLDPVEEEYAPNYYAVIRRPMDLRKMEERLDNAYYTDYSMFKADFKLIVNNCRLYNGQDNEYTVMVENLQNAFDRLTEKYIHRLSSSDEEIAVEYPLPTPSRKHKIKNSGSPERVQRKKRKSHSETVNPKSNLSESEKEKEKEAINNSENKESHKSKGRKSKKKRKGRHRHGKHSKSRDKSSHKLGEGEECKSSKRAKKSKRLKEKKSKKKKHKENKEENPEKNLESSNILESPESSNRSRSASPLPSIHTPTPSPTEPEPLPDPDFYKDKYDKIKERKRTTVKDAWESLINHKQKSGDKQKQNLLVPEKDKNRKLTETIEKLKAKNEKYKDSTIFNSLFTSGNQGSATNINNNTAESSVKANKETDSSNEEIDDSDCEKGKQGQNPKKAGKKKNHTTKNEITSEALEQAVKDISKLLDDKPKGSTTRTPPDSPTPTISTEEQDSSRQDDELYEKALSSRKEFSRKRPSSREPRILKRRELQRTIDRLQPGKSKGNLLTNVTTTQKVEEQPPIGTVNKVRDVAKAGESSPKLSLGSVLPTVDFTLGNDLNFNKNEENTESQNVTTKNNEPIKNDVVEENNSEDVSERVINEPQNLEERVDDQQSTKTGQEKATPNLSAWFKAFGAPKSSATGRKKTDDSEQEDKPGDTNSTDNTPLSPKTTTKYDSPGDEISPNPEGGDSPLLTQRHRRTSTGSSVSERSSFSQDLDSPRHQIAHTSPLLRSPASPRTDEFQKITYPIINGTIRAGFYQDTTSLKSSPEKSCSPRDAPQSPYSPYAQHVYASNSMASVNSTMQSPNYFTDHNKSSIPTYGQALSSPCFETAKPLIVNKPENLQQNQYSNRFSPNHTSYPQEQPLTFGPNQDLAHSNVPSTPAVPAKVLSESKPQMFPVKKRAYNDLETMSATKTLAENTVIKDDLPLPSNKEEYQNIVQSIHSLTSSPSSTGVSNLTNEKHEVNKTNDLRDKNSVELIDRHLQNLERHTNMAYESNNSMTLNKKEADNLYSKPLVMTKKDTAGIVHSGYNNIEAERRKREETSTQNHNTQIEYNTVNVSKVNTGTLPKGYEIDAIAINLGLNHAQTQKALNKNSLNPDFLNPEHAEKISPDALNHSFTEFDNLPLSGSSSLNDINVDLNKKLFTAHSSTPIPSDYESWKAASKDSSPADLSTSFSVENNKVRLDSACTNTSISNYKNYEYSQYENYTMAHSNLSRNQELPQSMISELRIPNPRSHLKNDTLTSLANNNLDTKTVDTPKSQKSNNSTIDHPLLGRYPYKGAFIPHGPLEPFLNIPGVFDRFTNDERFYSRFAAPLNREKSFTMSQMLSKGGSPNAYQNSPCVSIFNHANHTLSTDKEFGYYKNPQIGHGELMTTKEYNKKKKTSTTKHHQSANSQSSQPSTSSVDVLSTTKPGMPPGSAFNFGTAQSAMALGSLYTDSGGFSIEDFRNSTANQLMTGGYMTASATSHQRSNKETNPEKFVKPAHQNRAHTSSSFPFMDHTQVRPSYSFVGTDPSSPLYQQYLQRHQEHLLRQTGAQIMSLYPTGYPSNLSVRQPYDSINRPSWL